MAWTSARHESPTIDEPYQLTSGYLYWQTGRYFLDPIHPPLARLWMALPIAHLHLPDFYPPPRSVIDQRMSLSTWLLTGQGLYGPSLIARGRFMMLLASVALGCLVALWAYHLFGPLEAVAAAGLYACCPVLLAYGPLLSTDMAVTAAGIGALYMLWRYTQAPSHPRAWGAGAAMGIALMCKFTAVLLLPVAALLTLLHGRRHKARTTDYHLLGYVTALIVVIIFAYRGHELYRIGWGLSDLRDALHGPADQYFHGHINSGRPWLWFLPACLLLKTPLAFLALVLCGGLLALRHRYPHWRAAFAWWIFPAAFFLIASLHTNGQFGIRRVLLIYPLLTLWAAGAWAALWRGARVSRGIAITLALMYAGGTLRSYPTFFNDFNRLAGGPSNGYRYLLDCNSDWGQALPALADYLKAHRIGMLYLCYFGGGTPRDYGIRYRELKEGMAMTPLSPDTETYVAISETALAGIPYEGRDPFADLRRRPPLAVIDGSIAIFKIDR